MHYYNEFEPKTAAWLEKLIACGLIPNGHVDKRSITDLTVADLRGYTSCHFFAGIGGWPYALRLAGWPDDKPVWTGSCPCQPFSSAGKGLGVVDPRDLWPTFARLIADARPPVVFGEQVASAIGHLWLDRVRADLEAEGYAIGAPVLGAHSVGSPQIRLRLYWVADALGSSAREWREPGGESRPRGPHRHDTHGCCSGLGHPHGAGLSEQRGPEPIQTEQPTPELRGHVGFWDEYILAPCADGKTRRLKPGLAPLAHGLPARVVRLRGYGNAIVPQVAAEFIQAFQETL